MLTSILTSHQASCCLVVPFTCYSLYVCVLYCCATTSWPSDILWPMYALHACMHASAGNSSSKACCRSNKVSTGALDCTRHLPSDKVPNCAFPRAASYAACGGCSSSWPSFFCTFKTPKKRKYPLLRSPTCCAPQRSSGWKETLRVLRKLPLCLA